MTFLHGVETIEIENGPRPVRAVKTAVVGLVGTAPIHHAAPEDQLLNDSIVISNDVAAARYFGPEVAGYTIPQALRAIYAQGATPPVVVVNVFDPATHKTDVVAADLDITNGEIQLANGDIISEVVKEAGGAGSAYVEGVDYSIDRVKGIITVIEGGELDGDAQANVAYSYGDPSAVLAADIIGGVDGGGNRTGMQHWLDSFTKFGFNPKILIAPGYSTEVGVMTAMQTLAQKDKLRAVFLPDAPVGTAVADAIEGRGPSGSINFNVSDRRGYLLYPHMSVYDAASDSNVLEPYSPFMAGVIARTDLTRGFWNSPSNKPILGIVGTEVPVSAAINDPSSEANQLNEVGITTVFNSFGTGFRTWGNRSAAFPAESGIKSFIKMTRISDQIDESIELSLLPFIDEDITDAMITNVLDSVNGYMNTLINRGALVPGSRVEFHAAKNPPLQLSNGHLVFTKVFMANPPAERFTFESLVDINLLQR